MVMGVMHRRGLPFVTDQPLVVFHGANAASFRAGIEDVIASFIAAPVAIAVVADGLESLADQALFQRADVIVSPRFSASAPRPVGLKLFQVPGAGTDAVDIAALPAGVTVCNCFGHEQAIAEYAFTAMLARVVPLTDADRRLRGGDWAYYAGAADRAHGELAGLTLGLLGFGHIGRAIAARARAFEMRVVVANRSAVQANGDVDAYLPLDRLDAFWPQVDIIVVSVPLTPETTGIVNAAAFRAMRPGAMLINVGRGPTVDEAALFEALKTQSIAGAAIDTWYAYPPGASTQAAPGNLTFHELPGLLMTPHMSGWTDGTIRRRQRSIAHNIAVALGGADRRYLNLVRKGAG